MKYLPTVLAAALAACLSPAHAAAGDDADAARVSLHLPKQTLSYGKDKLQSLDLWVPRAAKEAPVPLVVFVHGGGWRRGDKDNATGAYKASHYTRQGYAFASINYRLVPQATVEQQAQDLADAVAALVKQGRALGIDRSRIVLMGHSAGAHLSALVGTDPQYLQAAGLTLDVLDGVIPIDGAAYDIPAQIAQSGRVMKPIYLQAFGTDSTRRRALSPTFQAKRPNVKNFLLLHVQRDDGIKQANSLAAALRRNGSKVEIASFAGEGLRGHAEINRRLGDPRYPATATVDAWLARIFGT